MSTPSTCRRTSLVVVALALAGCRDDSTGVPSSLASRFAADDAQFSDDDAPQYSDWSEPVNLSSVVNSPSADIEVSISKDGLSLHFASNRPGGFGRQDIWVSRRASTNDPWGPPRNLGPTINTAFDDRTPMITVDGHRMYFSSDRPGGLGGTDTYVSGRRDERDDLAWQAPENLGSGVNTSFNENLPFYFDDDATGAVLYFNSNRPAGAPGTGMTDIYASARQPDESFGPAVLVPELNSPLRDAGMAIRRDGLELILASDRAGTFGVFDLWVSTRASTLDPWSTPVNLGSTVNSAAGEARLSLSFDGTTLYISGDRAGGVGVQDLWVSTRSKLKGPD